MATTTSSSSEEAPNTKKNKKECLGWIEWLRGWFYLVYEMLFQRIMASHLHNPMPLPPVNDLTCIVTGSTSGIGLEIARFPLLLSSLQFYDDGVYTARKLTTRRLTFWQLAQSGAHVVMAVRNTKAAQELIQKWQVDSEGLSIPLNVEVMQVDLLSLDSVTRFAEAWNARSAPLHVLINNAGIFSIGEPQKFSKDGYEQHLQVNHLAPALLSILLLPSLIRGSPSRIVNVNSIMHHVGFVDTEDMNVTSGKRKFSSLVGYSSSKLAEIMFSSILNKRLPAESGISVLCVSPGIVQTNVARDLPKLVQAAYHLIPYFIFSAQEGARSALFAATDPQVPEYCDMLKADEWPVCAFISQDCRPANPSEEAHNVQTSYEVWEKTLEMIGLPSDAVERLLDGEEVKSHYRQEQ
ncbi:Dehydrogenase/reductase SDR family member FEY [Glycine soja]